MDIQGNVFIVTGGASGSARARRACWRLRAARS
jgi:hypothetical protein